MPDIRRVLYLDGFGDNRLENLQLLSSKEDVLNLYDRYFKLEDPIDLCLDARSLTVRGLSSLLKFIEEYQGSITLVASEPVPAPVLSRFIEIQKFPVIKESHFLELFITKTPVNQQNRLRQLFDLKTVENSI